MSMSDTTAKERNEAREKGLAEFVAEKRRLYDDKSELQYLDEFFANKQSDKPAMDNGFDVVFPEKKDQVFDTGSRRDSTDHKPRISDLKAYTRERFGYHMLKGSINYGTGNFEKGQPDDRTLESIHRHLTKHELGDRSEDHLSAIIFGVQLIMLNDQKEDGIRTDYFYQKYVSSGEYDRDLARKREREEREMTERILRME